MIQKPSYQVTSHPIGSLREIWTLSWPLILSFLSTGLMVFIDRIMLGHFSVETMNASATSGAAALACLLLPTIIAGISELFVGQFNGEQNYQKMGSAVWQMIWFSVLMAPVFWIVAKSFPSFLFSGAQNPQLNTLYFQGIIFCGSIFCISQALFGFYLGQGNVIVVSIGVLAANLANFGLDYLLIFGTSWTPSLGIKGAALATVSTQMLVTLVLFLLFLKKKNRVHKGTNQLRLNLPLFVSSVKRGFAASLAHIAEYFGEYVLLICFNSVSESQLTIMVILHSLYNLIFFIIEGISKALSILTSNLIGAQKYTYIPKVLRSSMILHSILVLVTTLCMVRFSPHVFSKFMSGTGELYFSDPVFTRQLYLSSLLLCAFYFLDGILWNIVGVLIASADNHFIMFVGTLVPWLIEILPVYIAIKYLGASVDQVWLYMVLSSLVLVCIYWMRYRSQPWRKLAGYTQEAL